MTPEPLVDAHVHLWDPRRLRYPWLDGLPPLNRPFLPQHYRAACDRVGVGKMIFVECGGDTAGNLEEVRWVTALAASEPRLRGIVAQVAVERGVAARNDLVALAANPLVKGVRRLLQGETDPRFCLRPDFVAGVKSLAEFGFSFDLCVTHRQLAAATELVRNCPEVRFVLDHAGKPAIRDGLLDPWRQDLRSLAGLPNAWCKLSGLANEADHARWTPADLQPYVAHVLDCFGSERVMFGGDWPVATLATDYARWVTTVRTLAHLNAKERTRLFCTTAEAFYRV